MQKIKEQDDSRLWESLSHVAIAQSHIIEASMALRGSDIDGKTLRHLITKLAVSFGDLKSVSDQVRKRVRQ